MSIDKERVLYWLPVILLPAGNLLMLCFAPVSVNARTLLPSLIGAVTEELFFRWLLLKTVLLPRIKSKPAILLVSVLFAVMHLLNLRNGTSLPDVLVQMLCAFCFSVWAGAVTWQSTWLIPLLAHVLVNLTAITDETLLPILVSVAVLADGILLLKENVHHK